MLITSTLANDNINRVKATLYEWNSDQCLQNYNRVYDKYRVHHLALTRVFLLHVYLKMCAGDVSDFWQISCKSSRVFIRNALDYFAQWPLYFYSFPQTTYFKGSNSKIFHKVSSCSYSFHFLIVLRPVSCTSYGKSRENIFLKKICIFQAIIQNVVFQKQAYKHVFFS